MKVLGATLADLWRILDRRSRLLALGLVGMLFFSGILEMGGIFFLFGYISAISGAEADNPIAIVYRAFASDLEGRAFAIVAGLLFLFIFALKNASNLLTSFLLLRFSMKRYERTASVLFSGYLGSSLEVLHGKGVSGVIQIIRSTIQVFRNSFNAALAAVSEIAIITTVLLALLLFLHPLFVLIGGMLFGGGGYLFLTMTRSLSKRLGQRQQAEVLEMHHVMQESLRGLIDLRLADREGIMTERFSRIMGRLALVERRGDGLRSVPRAVNELLLATGIVLAAVFYAGRDGGVTAALPTLAVAGFAGLRLTAAVTRLTTALQKLRQGAVERRNLIAEIELIAPPLLGRETVHLDETVSAEDPGPVRKDPLRLQDRITVRDVTFTYSGADAPALRDVSMTIPKGSFIGLCGASGGGKSTLALVVMGLIHPQAGTVCCDERDIRGNLRSWHRNFGYVSQQAYVAPRNLRENVAFSLEPHEIDDARVWRALETARLVDLVGELPSGLHTNLGEDGIRLSGGQRQRICIARALYHDPEILVFDEATAALDTVTESEITKAILKFSGIKTVIAITHRLSTLTACDSIYLVKGGRIAAEGTFADLERRSEDFQRLLVSLKRRDEAGASARDSSTTSGSAGRNVG